MRLKIEKVVVVLAYCMLATSGVFAQVGNTISGHVFGADRTPVDSITVELVDDFGRSLGRIRTNASGFYKFTRMPAGIYSVRISPFGTNYKEQDARIEIQNMTRTDPGSGLQVIGAYMNAQQDFYLREDERKREPGRAETVFAQEIPAAAKSLYDEGDVLIKNKKNKEGYEKLKSSIETFPGYYLANERLGLEYFLAGYYEASSILLQRAVQIHPKSYKGWYGLGRAFLALKLHPEALEASKKALEVSPGSVDALLLTGKLLRRTTQFKDSEKHLKKAKSLSKNSMPDIHWELALLYGKDLKRYRDAADELETWLKLQPESKNAASIKELIRTYREKSKKT